MIPPLLMDCRPGMVVLDLCAAPGSKAVQLLEMIHAGEEARIRKVMKDEGDDYVLEADSSDDGRATGLLIANDADYKRTQMLVHQLKRMSSPNMIVTNHDATIYPSIRLPAQPGGNSNQQRFLKFDRILADVPCTGDGTLRKNINLWHDWSPNNAMGLHATQVRILVRALQMLKVRGRVVYSTCSMNPVENEAVIYTAIEKCGGVDKVDIIDCGKELPELLRRPGMSTWCLTDRTGKIFHSWQALLVAREKGEVASPEKFLESMFPRGNDNSDTKIPIERCMRIYPHLQDTGGFFITVMEKRSDIRLCRAEPKNEHSNGANVPSCSTPNEPKPADSAAAAADAPANPISPTKRQREDDPEEKAPIKRARSAEQPPKSDDPSDTLIGDTRLTSKHQDNLHRPRGHTEDPFKFLPPDHEVLRQIKNFYGISDRFPMDRYMVRNAMCDPAKAIYYTSAIVRDVMVENETRGVKFVHGGVKMFVKQEAPSAEVCRWRIQSDGLTILEGYVGENRVVYLHKKETLHRLLLEMFPVFKGDEWQSLGEIGERIRDMGMGCCVLRVNPKGDDPAFTERMVLPLWKSVHSLNLMLPKEDRSAMLLRIYNDTSPVVNQALNQTRKSKESLEDHSSTKPEAEPKTEEVLVDEGQDPTTAKGTMGELVDENDLSHAGKNSLESKGHPPTKSENSADARMPEAFLDAPATSASSPSIDVNVPTEDGKP